MHLRITSLNTERKEWTPQELLSLWQQHLQEHDRSAGTVKKYTQAVARFLAWYEREEQAPLQLSTLTPIALIGYRNELQHEQHKSTSTINLQVSAWCGWLTEQGYLAADPAAHVKLVGGETSSSRKGLRSAQVNALLRQAQNSRDRERNYAIVQVLLQLYRMVLACQPLYPSNLVSQERGRCRP
jgi:site-specific recombinase XerD